MHNKFSNVGPFALKKVTYNSCWFSFLFYSIVERKSSGTYICNLWGRKPWQPFWQLIISSLTWKKEHEIFTINIILKTFKGVDFWSLFMTPVYITVHTWNTHKRNVSYLLCFMFLLFVINICSSLCEDFKSEGAWLLNDLESTRQSPDSYSFQF